MPLTTAVSRGDRRCCAPPGMLGAAAVARERRRHDPTSTPNPVQSCPFQSPVGHHSHARPCCPTPGACDMRQSHTVWPSILYFICSAWGLVVNATEAGHPRTKQMTDATFLTAVVKPHPLAARRPWSWRAIRPAAGANGRTSARSSPWTKRPRCNPPRGCNSEPRASTAAGGCLTP